MIEIQSTSQLVILALVILVVMQCKLSNRVETSTQQGLRYVETPWWARRNLRLEMPF